MQTFSFEPGKHEGVDWIARPGTVLDAGQLRAFWRDEGPVCFPLRPLLYPSAQRLDLTRAELVAPLISRRHSDRWVVRCDALDQFARGRIARNDNRLGSIFLIKAELGFALSRIGSVAGVTLVGQDGPDIAIELDGARFGGAADRSQQQRDNGIAEPHVSVRSIVVRGRRPSGDDRFCLLFACHSYDLAVRRSANLVGGKERSR